MEIVFASLKKRVKKFILVFVQFLVGLTVLLFGIYSVEKFFHYKKNVEHVLPLKTIHIYGTEDETDGKNSQYADFLKEIQKSNPSVKLGVFENVLIERDGVEGSYLMWSREAMDIFYAPVDKSKILQLKKYKDEKVVPVLISSDMAKYYKEGDICSFPDDTILQFESYKMKVIGILEEGAMVSIGGSSDISSSIKVAEKTIIGPEIFAFDYDYVYNYNLICVTRDNVDLKAEFLRRGWVVKIQTVQEEIFEYFQREKVVMFGAIGFSIILLILSVIGCVGTLLSMLLSRGEEFGIYFSLGMQKRSLAMLVLGEISIIFFISYLFALLIFVSIIYGGIGEASFAPIGTMCITLVIMFLCALLCVILPIRKIMHWKPVELLCNQRK